MEVAGVDTAVGLNNCSSSYEHAVAAAFQNYKHHFMLIRLVKV